MKSSIAENLKAVREKIKASALRVGRNPDDIKIVVVTKTIDVERIIEAIRAGALILGENRVQEASNKIPDLRKIIPPLPPFSKGGVEGLEVEWHLIGPLQRNKAKYAVQIFDLIHSLDSIALAEELNKQAKKIEKIQRVLVQVKLAEEETKHGVLESDLIPLLERVGDLKHLRLEGLMTMPPFFEAPECVRPYFKRLREIRDDINASRITHYELRELSMGMSNDYEVAVEEGATMVRIGTAIFGERK